jgi:hypothetical protein
LVISQQKPGRQMRKHRFAASHGWLSKLKSQWSHNLQTSENSKIWSQTGQCRRRSSEIIHTYGSRWCGTARECWWKTDQCVSTIILYERISWTVHSKNSMFWKS